MKYFQAVFLLPLLAPAMLAQAPLAGDHVPSVGEAAANFKAPPQRVWSHSARLRAGTVQTPRK